MKFLKHKSAFFILLSSLFLFFFITPVDAAQLSIESSANEIKIGDTVTFTVFVNSDNKSVNNIEGQIEVPSDFLTLICG
jgi:preprotein translocase subunit YajC